MSPDPWERLRHMTIDQVITEIKLNKSSAFTLIGRSTPEGYPFAVFFAVAATPGDAFGVELIVQIEKELERRASWVKRAANPKASP